MDAFVLGVVVGLAGGAITTALVTQLKAKRRAAGQPVEPLAAGDVPADELTTYETAVAQQVGIYADGLAGDDPVLRERLRRFERSGS